MISSISLMFRKWCATIFGIGVLLAPLPLWANTHANIEVFTSYRDHEVSVRITGFFDPASNDRGKEGAVFIFARLLSTNPLAPDTFWYQDSGQNWHLFTDCRITAAVFTGQLELISQIPIINIPTGIFWLEGSELYIGYGLGGLGQATGQACNDMLLRKNWFKVYSVTAR